MLSLKSIAAVVALGLALTLAPVADAAVAATKHTTKAHVAKKTTHVSKSAKKAAAKSSKKAPAKSSKKAPAKTAKKGSAKTAHHKAA